MCPLWSQEVPIQHYLSNTDGYVQDYFTSTAVMNALTCIVKLAIPTQKPFCTVVSENNDSSCSTDFQETTGPVYYSRTSAIFVNSSKELWKVEEEINVDTRRGTCPRCHRKQWTCLVLKVCTGYTYDLSSFYGQWPHQVAPFLLLLAYSSPFRSSSN